MPPKPIKKTSTPARSTAKPGPSKAGAAKTGAKKTSTGGAAKTTGGAAAKQEPPKVEERPHAGVDIILKALNTTLADGGGEIKKSGKWPLIMDPAGTAGTFLMYRDVNMLSVATPNDMQPERIRQAIMGSARYQKPCVLDLGDIDCWVSAVEAFNQLQPGLMDIVMSKDIYKEENIKLLTREKDGEEFDHIELTDWDTNFHFYLLTKKVDPEAELMLKVYPIRVGMA